MAITASSAPTSITAANQRPSIAAARHRARGSLRRLRARPGPADARRAGQGIGVAVGDEAVGDHRRPAQAGREGQPHPDRAEMRVEHQQTAPADVTLTRLGYWAL